MLSESVSQVALEAACSVRLVVIDTLSRALAGGNENAPEAMTTAVASTDAVRAATGAHVAIVHHCGKDEARGSRGHSSLKAAVDTEIELYQPEGENVTTAKVLKQRDLPKGALFPFTLEVVELGINRRGKPVTSCTVKHEDEVMASERGKGGRKATSQPEDLLKVLPAATVKDWLRKADEELGVKSSKFYEHKRFLESKGRVKRNETGIFPA